MVEVNIRLPEGGIKILSSVGMYLHHRVGRLYKQGWPGCYIYAIHYKSEVSEFLTLTIVFYKSYFTFRKSINIHRKGRLNTEPEGGKNYIFSFVCCFAAVYNLAPHQHLELYFFNFISFGSVSDIIMQKPSCSSSIFEYGAMPIRIVQWMPHPLIKF